MKTYEKSKLGLPGIIPNLNAKKTITSSPNKKSLTTQKPKKIKPKSETLRLRGVGRYGEGVGLPSGESETANGSGSAVVGRFRFSVLGCACVDVWPVCLLILVWLVARENVMQWGSLFCFVI